MTVSWTPDRVLSGYCVSCDTLGPLVRVVDDSIICRCCDRLAIVFLASKYSDAFAIQPGVCVSCDVSYGDHNVSVAPTSSKR